MSRRESQSKYFEENNEVRLYILMNSEKSPRPLFIYFF